MNAEQLKSSHFSDYLQSCQVIFDLKAKTKVEAFEELLDLLKEHNLIKNRKPVLTGSSRGKSWPPPASVTGSPCPTPGWTPARTWP